ncbi:MAG: hypothetical protein ASARMPRED_001528 [Alectoria sarmentosa]|nr:MAG: hypothetical protein ASARMPRED_001528 [Alectoria sarmentosa]
MAHPQRIYGCGKDEESQTQPLREAPKINSVSHVSGQVNLQVDTLFEHKDAVYIKDERGPDGMPKKTKYYVCCAEPFEGVMHYRLKDEPPPSEHYVTGWIPENSIREWYLVPERIKPVDKYPPGYGRVAAFEDCDPSFSILRKFGWLHSRVLLHLQDELQELEEELESLDSWELSSGDPSRLKSRRLDDERPNALRKALLIKIHEGLLRLHKKQAIRKPTKRNQNSVYNAIHNSKSMTSGEALWIRDRDDLLALAKDAEHGWFNGILEDTLRKLSPKITLAIFRTPELKKRTGSMSSMSLISPYRIDVLLRIILTIIAVVLLLIPVLILYEIQPTTASETKCSSRAQIATIFSFTIAFSASCSIFTKARRQEVFTATAAYCAVLVVFLGNTSNVIVLPTGS